MKMYLKNVGDVLREDGLEKRLIMLLKINADELWDTI